MRRIAISIAIVVLLAAVLVVATPWFLSSDMVKQRIAVRMEELTGLKTTLRGNPKLSLIPFLEIKLKDVVVANPPEFVSLYGAQPFVSMDSLKGRLKLLPAIFGRPELADLRLVRPQINLTITPQGKTNWTANKGVLAALFSRAAQHVEENPDPKKQNAADIAPVRLGNFEIENGIINYKNDQIGRTTEVTSVNMRLSWPSSDASATISGSLVWQGENVELSGSIEKPMNLFIDNSSEVTLNISSEPLMSAFSGSADFRHSPKFSGSVEASSPSVRQMLRWIGYDIAPGSTPGAMLISSKLSSAGSDFKFQDATISLDENSGTGFINMNVSEDNRVKLEGTLAFDKLNFDPYFEALDANRGDESTDPEIANIDLIEEFDLDLRFSAKTATLGAISMTSMAATAQINRGNVIIDIGEASLFDGMVQAQIQAKEEGGEPAGDLKLNLIDVDLGELSQFVSPVGLKIIGKGTAAISLESTGRNVSQLVQKLNGSISISATEGRIEGLDLAKIAREGSNVVFLDANEVLAKGTDFTKLNIGMHIANGISLFEDTLLEGDRLLARIGGKADLWRKSLAMNGQVLLFKSAGNSEDENRAVELDIPFFIGGTLSTPLFAPDLMSPKREQIIKKSPKGSFSSGRPKKPKNASALN